VSGPNLVGGKIAEALGLAGRKVTRIVIEVEATQPYAVVTVTEAHFDAGELVEALRTFHMVEQTEQKD